MDNGRTDPANTGYRKNWDRIFGKKPTPTKKTDPVQKDIYPIIVKNAIRCLNCGDEIESTHRHDFVSCSCGQCSVDGGHDYFRRCGEGYEDISVTEPWCQPRAGDVLDLLVGIKTSAGVTYDFGDGLKLIRPSKVNFHGWPARDCWVIGCKHFPEGTIWENIENMLRDRTVRLIRIGGSDDR